jgi:kynurenine formamidase
MSDDLVTLIRRGLTVHDLSRPYLVGMPQSPSHPPYLRTMPRRHGDLVRTDGGSSASDLIVFGTHVGTHIDAIGHIAQDGLLHGDIDAVEAQRGGGFHDHGIHRFEPGLFRAILLDVPAAIGVDALEPDHQITPSELESALALAGVSPTQGDVLLVRSGWGARWDDGPAYVGTATGVPGVGVDGARWLAAHRPLAVGGDSITFEQDHPGEGHAALPVHRILLVEHGINIVENLDLERIARAGTREFALVLAPLMLVGATGSPVRALALVPGRRAGPDPSR